MNTAIKKCSRVNTQKVYRSHKPKVFIEKLPDGRLHIYGSTAAAKYVGVTQQSFDRVVRRHYNPPRHSKTVYSVVAKVREAYPELFSEGVGK